MRHSERLAKESSNTNLIQLQGMKINLNEIDYASMPLDIFASKSVSLLGWKAQPTRLYTKNICNETVTPDSDPESFFWGGGGNRF